MSEEEINKKIDYFNQHEINVSDEKSEKILREAEKVINGIIDLYHELKEKNASLQKEIEELEERNAEQLEVITEWVNGERINDIKHISKDKVKNKIKELEVMLRTYIENSKNDIYYNSEYVNSIEMSIKTLKELLEENKK